jgi:hypothetical protein
VVVKEGLTVCVPPVVPSVYELPSLPLIVTWVALVATTFSEEEPPEAIDVGLAVMLTVGNALTVTIAVADALPAAPLAFAV